MLLRIMYLLLRPNDIFFSAVYGIWNFTISVHFDKILKTFDEKNNINLSMLSETYLGKCNFKKLYYYLKNNQFIKLNCITKRV